MKETLTLTVKGIGGGSGGGSGGARGGASGSANGGVSGGVSASGVASGGVSGGVGGGASGGASVLPPEDAGELGEGLQVGQVDDERPQRVVEHQAQRLQELPQGRALPQALLGGFV